MIMGRYKTLVTGALGFIYRIKSYKRVKREESWGLVCDLPHSEGPSYVRCDVSKCRQVEQISKDHNFDYVYHLVAEYGRWNVKDYYEYS